MVDHPRKGKEWRVGDLAAYKGDNWRIIDHDDDDVRIDWCDGGCGGPAGLWLPRHKVEHIPIDSPEESAELRAEIFEWKKQAFKTRTALLSAFGSRAIAREYPTPSNVELVERLNKERHELAESVRTLLDEEEQADALIARLRAEVARLTKERDELIAAGIDLGDVASHFRGPDGSI